MTTYFTSDWHCGHLLVAGHRGFWLDKNGVQTPDVDAHDQALLEAGSILKHDDIVWWQGDLCTSERSWRRALDLIGSLPGRKRLIFGNHDPVASFHRNAWKFMKSAMEVFETVQAYGTVSVGGQKIRMSHFPYSGTGAEGLRNEDGTEREERFSEFRLKDCGTPLLHGHTHGPEKLHYSDRGTPQVHIGPDAWNMRLVSEHEVEALLPR